MNLETSISQRQKRNSYSSRLIAIVAVHVFIIFSHCSLGQEINNLHSNHRSKKKPIKTIKKLQRGFSGILAKNLFENSNGELQLKIIKGSHSLKEIQKLSDGILLDIANIFFKEGQGTSLVILSNSLSPVVNCKKKLLKLTPAFLQKLYENSCKASIQLSHLYFEDHIIIKNYKDYIFFIVASNHDIRKKIKHLGIDETELSFELERISTFINYEITNIFAFIYGHETYHFLTECKTNQEFYADELGILAYQFLNFSIDYDLNRLTSKYLPPSLNARLNEKMVDGLLHLFIGRKIDKIVYDLYNKTQYENGRLFHPNLEDRIEQINKIITETHPDTLFKKFIDNQILSNYENN